MVSRLPRDAGAFIAPTLPFTTPTPAFTAPMPASLRRA
jgi:hypothetical protein